MEEQQELQDTATTSCLSKLPPINQNVAVTSDSEIRSMDSLYCSIVTSSFLVFIECDVTANHDEAVVEALSRLDFCTA